MGFQCQKCKGFNTLNQGFGYSKDGSVTVRCHDCDEFIDTGIFSGKTSKNYTTQCPKCKSITAKTITSFRVYDKLVEKNKCGNCLYEFGIVSTLSFDHYFDRTEGITWKDSSEHVKNQFGDAIW